MRTQEDHEVMSAMLAYGGSFVKALAEAAFRADPVNLHKIKTTWPDLWETYGPQFRKRDAEKIQGGTYHGKTVAEVMADRDDYNRLCGS